MEAALAGLHRDDRALPRGLRLLAARAADRAETALHVRRAHRKHVDAELRLDCLADLRLRRLAGAPHFSANSACVILSEIRFCLIRCPNSAKILFTFSFELIFIGLPLPPLNLSYLNYYNTIIAIICQV